MHSHSIIAHHATSQLTSKRSLEIYQWLTKHGPATDRNIALSMSFPDMNCVRPRVTELIRQSWAEEIGSARCPITGRKVRVTQALTQHEHDIRSQLKSPAQLQLL